MAAAGVFLLKLGLALGAVFLLVQLILHPWKTLRRIWNVFEVLGTLLEMLG